MLPFIATEKHGFLWCVLFAFANLLLKQWGTFSAKHAHTEVIEIEICNSRYRSTLRDMCPVT